MRKNLLVLAVPTLGTVLACASGPHLTPIPATAGPEYAVYAALLTTQRGQVVVLDTTQPMYLCRPSASSCWAATATDDFKVAAADYLLENATAVRLQPALGPAAHLARDWTGPPITGCQDTPRVTLTRVGFSPDTTRAVAGYSVRVGQGPYPGCGYVAGAIVGLSRSPDGTWRITREFMRWTT
jgi:hypothetical protein